jgi:class 3 adenylate cyclase/FixJ family two-component response regulator
VITPDGKNMSQERVLVVDDSQQTRDLVVGYVLAPNGYRCEVARDGAEGLRKAMDMNPDLIIMDLEMPKMTGLEMLEALHEKRVNIPSIMMTFHGSERVAVQAFRLGVRDYVIKPFDVDDMLASIERALAEARLRRERDALTTKLIQANRQLETRVRDLNALHGIGRSVTALLDHDGLLTRVVEAALYVTTAEEGAIFLLDDAQRQLLEHVVLRRSGGRVPHASSEAPLQFARQAIRNLQPATSGSVMCVPLVVGGKVLGALGVNNGSLPRPFNDDDQQMLQALGDYAAIAIHNSRLFAQVRASKEREKQQLRNLFEHYVSPRVVERLIASPQTAVLGGARQTVTVLFADVRGFSSFVEQTQPEVLMQVLNRYLAAAATAVLGADGTLDKFMGDGVMALFNAPLPQPDHALRAAKAAWAIQQSVDQVHQDLPPSLHLRFGIGICSGDAVVGNIGAAQLMNYTAMGDCVNVAKRLQEAARGGQILLDAKSYDLVRGQVRVSPIGPITFKGRAAPEVAFELLGI